MTTRRGRDSRAEIESVSESWAERRRKLHLLSATSRSHSSREALAQKEKKKDNQVLCNGVDAISGKVFFSRHAAVSHSQLIKDEKKTSKATVVSLLLGPQCRVSGLGFPRGAGS